MNSNKTLITNSLFIIVISLITSIIVMLIVDRVYSNTLYWIPVGCGTYALVNQIFSVIAIKKLKSGLNNEKIELLKRFCTDKIGLARAYCQKGNDVGLIHCFKDLEFYVTEITKCCKKQCDLENFQTAKGLISSTKTTFDRGTIDNQIPRPFDDAILAVSNLESYLMNI